MRRREFITLLVGSAAFPSATRAQQQMPVIGLLGSWRVETDPLVAAFLRGLNEMGFIEGRNVAIYHNPADLGPDRLPDFAADMVRQRVSVIFTGSNVGALAAKAATSDIPI